MSDSPSQLPQPPQPPEMERRFELYTYQMIAIPLLILIPILALFGVFGETTDTARAEAEPVFLSVEYPTRILYAANHTIHIEVTNAETEVLPSLTLRIDRSYLRGFTSVSTSPEVDRITADAYEIELEDLAAGETRIVIVDVTADGYGTHSGSVTVSEADAEITRVELQTLVYP